MYVRWFLSVCRHSVWFRVCPVLLEKQLGKKNEKRLTTKKTLYVKILKRGHFSYSLRIYRALRSVARKKKGERKGEKKQAKEIRINLRTSSTHREKVWLRVASEQTRDESYNSTRATTLFPCPTLLLLLGSAWWDFLHLTGAEILGLRTSVAWRDNEHLVVSFISTLHSERKPLFSFSSSFWAGCLTSWQKKKKQKLHSVEWRKKENTIKKN